MSTEVSFDSNIIQLLLIIGIILLMGGYFYYENLKIKNQLLEFEYKLNKLSESLYPDNQLNERDISKDIQMESFHPNFPKNFEGGVVSERVVSEREEKEIMEHEEIHDGMAMSEEPMKDEISDEWKNISEQMKNDSDSEDDSDKKTITYIRDEVDLDNVNRRDEHGQITDADDLLKSFTIDEMLNDINSDEKDINSDEKKDLNQEIQSETTELDYKGMTVSQLKSILVEKNLPVSGNKTKLIQRILDNDK